jgi:hypothetical protein
MQNWKRWFPFIIIIVIMIISIFYMNFNKQVIHYHPVTDSPKVMYREACQYCHGDQGQGTGFLYPGFDSDDLTKETIRSAISNGGFLMPAYPHIIGDTLKVLVDYIFEGKFKEPSSMR